MSALDPRVTQWLHSHRATVTADHLDHCGVTPAQLERLVAQRYLCRIVDGCYTLGGVPVDNYMRCVAICTSRPELVIAGPTAGQHWEIHGTPKSRYVHAIGPAGSNPCRAPWLKIYRTDRLDAEDVIECADGMRVTDPARTAVDLARYVGFLQLEALVEYVLGRGLVTEWSLGDCAERVATPGRPWARRVLRILEARAPGAATESAGERKVFNALRRRGVADLVRQFRIELPRYGHARFDLAIPELLYDLEIDLHPSHRTPEGRASDKRRDEAAAAMDWLVRRLDPVELDPPVFEQTLDAVTAQISRRRNEVAARRASGWWTPSPR